MTIPAPALTGYSAEVDLTLIVGSQRVPLAAAGPDQVTACEAAEFSPGQGELEIIVDGHRSVYVVDLPAGGVPFDRHIPIRVRRAEGRAPIPPRLLFLPHDPEWFRSL